MPMQMGTLMVTIRAQDFASRTLRRVSGEFAAMSREQRIAQTRDAINADLQRANSRVALAESNRRRLALAQEATAARRAFDVRTAALQRYADAQRDVMRTDGRGFRTGVTRAQQVAFQNASKAVRDFGLEGVRAAQRYDRAMQDVAQHIARNQFVPRIEPRRATQALQRMLGADAFRAFARFRDAQMAVNKAMSEGLPVTRAMRGEVQAAERAWNSFGGTAARQIQNFDALGNRVSKLDRILGGQTGLQRLAMSSGALGNALARNRTELQEAYRGLTQAQQAAMNFDAALRKMPLQRLDNIGHAMAGIGRTFQLFGAISTVALGAMSNRFANFNTQVTLAATQTRAAGESFSVTAEHADRLTKIIENMMQVFPANSDQMAQAAYDIFSSIDVSFGTGVRLLREFNKVAVAGSVDLATATNASISVLENFDDELRNHGRITETTTGILNRMFAIVRFGRMNFSQFTGMLNSVIPAAKGAQQSFDSISGAMAVLTRHIPSQRQAAVSLARGLDVLTNPDFQKGMANAGLAITDFQGRLLPLPKIIERVAALKPKRLNTLIQTLTAFGRGQGRGLQSTIQARRFFNTILSNINEYRRVQGQVIGDNTEFAASFAAMNQTLGVRWQVFLNRLRVLVLYIGEQAIPIFLRVSETIQGWIDAWQRMSPHTRGMIVRFTAILGIATLVSGVFLSIAGALVSLTAALINIGPKFATATENLRTIVGMTKALAGIGLITLGIQLLKKGDGWNLLGGAGVGAGLAMLMGRGGRGTAIGATIGIAATLAFKGDGWQSKIGQILLGGAAGFAAGGPFGAAAGAALATIPILIEAHAETRSLEKTMQEYDRLREAAIRTNAAVQNISPNQAAREMGEAMFTSLRGQGIFEINSKAGFEAAVKFLEGYVKGLVRSTGPRDAFDGLMRDLEKKTPNVDSKLTLREALRSTKSYTEIMDLVNQQMQSSVDKAAQLAINISRAVEKGNELKGSAILQNFLKVSRMKVTDKNILGLIHGAVASGDIQSATQYIDQYAQAVQQGDQDLKTYRDNMKQYRKDVIGYNKDMAQSASEAATQTVDTMRQMYMTLQQQNEQAMGQLFQGPFLTSETFNLAQEWGITPRAVDIIRDMREQVTDFETRMKNLATLGRRGIPQELLDQLKTMPPDQANPLIEALKNAPPSQIRQIVNLWKRRQADIQKQTRVDFNDEIKHFKQAGLKMGEALTMGFQEANVAKWFDNWVRVRFPNVINAAMNQAVRDFKAGREVPTAPTRPNVVTGRPRAAPPAHRRPQPTRRPQATAPRYTGAAMGHPPPARDTGTGATYTYNFNQQFHGIQPIHFGEAAKKAAFHARNAVKGRGK